MLNHHEILRAALDLRLLVYATCRKVSVYWSSEDEDTAKVNQNVPSCYEEEERRGKEY